MSIKTILAPTDFSENAQVAFETAFDLALEATPDARLSAQLEEMSLEDAERLLIKKALARYEGNANRAAEALGLSRSALYRRLQKYNLS